jgi:hypothetical protein
MYGFTMSGLKGEEIKSQIRLIPESKEYHEGDIVELDLKIWPIESADLDEFKKIEGTTLYNALEVEQVTSVLNSENNADVVEIKATAIVVSSPDKSEGIVNYKNNKIKIFSPEFKFIPIQAKKEDFYILDQSSVGEKKNIILLISIMLIALAIIFVVKKIKKPKDPKIEIKNLFQNVFSNANERHEFEIIYSRKSEWMSLIAVETQQYKDFFKTMEIHQYKKHWSSEEFEEVKNSFEPIRRSFL